MQSEIEYLTKCLFNLYIFCIYKVGKKIEESNKGCVVLQIYLAMLDS